MPSITDFPHYEIKDFQTIGSTQVLNVYYYRSAALGPGPSLGDVADAFVLNIVDNLIPQQNTTVTHELVEVRQLNSLDIIHQETLTGKTGTLVGDPLPNFIALSVKLNRSSRETRNGFKRYAGRVEQDVAQNFFNQAVVDVFTAALGGPLVSFPEPVLGVTMQQVIIRKTDPDAPDPRAILPESQWIYNNVIGISANRLVKTQDTRLVGRGV